MTTILTSASLVLSHLLAAAAGAKLSSSEGEEEASLDPLQRLGEDIRNVAEVVQISCKCCAAETIPGTPGEDYPVFPSPPETRFVCDGYVAGYYADQEARWEDIDIDNI